MEIGLFIIFMSFLFQGAIHEVEGGGELFRLIPVFGFLSSAVIGVVKSRANTFLFKPNFADGVFVVLFFASSLHVFIGGIAGPVLYALTFLVTAYSIFICFVVYGFYRIINVFLQASFVVFCIAVATDFEGLVSALTVTRTEIGLLRYMALGAHPNLTGHNFGIAAVLALCMFIQSRGRRDKIWFGVLLACFLLMPLAASSRGALMSILASVFVGSIFLFLNRANAEPHVRRVLHFLPLLFFVVSILVIYKIEYVLDLLELNTESRGFDSGMSGRGDNWVKLLEFIFSIPSVFVFGAGFRTWADDIYGYATDSSYLNLMWELGIPISLYVFVTTLYLYVLRMRSPSVGANLLMVCVFSFMLTEGTVARYLYGIGNPASSLFLGIFLVAAHREWHKRSGI